MYREYVCVRLLTIAYEMKLKLQILYAREHDTTVVFWSRSVTPDKE